MAEAWLEANQRRLALEFARIHAIVKQRLAQSDASDVGGTAVADATPTKQPSAIDSLVTAFGLSHFERDVVLLCAGAELSADISALLENVRGDSPLLTFRLLLALLPGAHWSATTPAGALRRHHLLVVQSEASLTQAAIRIDERVLHHLVGLDCLDQRLQGPLLPLAPCSDTLPPSLGACVERLVKAFRSASSATVSLSGEDAATRRLLLAVAASRLEKPFYQLRAGELPTATGERQLLAELWSREAALSGAALVIECEEELESAHAVASFVHHSGGCIALSSRDPVRSPEEAISIEVPRPGTLEQRALWESALGEHAKSANGALDRVIGQFQLGPVAIHAVGRAVQKQLEVAPPSSFESLLWEGCRTQARVRLDDLAQRLVATASFDDLVLPQAQLDTLREIAAHVRQRTRVYETWGFARRGARGLGVSTLFSGVSGTGKTMAAEALADSLRLDLYRIDLSQVVSKYIGETEKNLRRIFDLAEQSGAVLLFDEADALFGKRSEVRDSHDRYANIEVSYLLQRMESYRGLAILTTNLKASLDPAFLRRLRFIVQFPFPDASQRLEIWRRVFPANTPTRGLELEKLARLGVAGGNIHSIALNATFLAADANSHVTMRHVLAATRSEYAKMEKTLSEAEIGGWV
jgi:hypothetical protein